MTYARSATYPGSHPPDTDWHERMNCSTANPALFDFDATTTQRLEAEEICLSCPVFVPCDTDTKARIAAGEEVRGYFAGIAYRTGRPVRHGPRRPRKPQPSRARLAGKEETCALPACGNVFVRTRFTGRKLFCSRACSNKARYLRLWPKTERECAYRECTRRFVSSQPRQLFCCDSHRTKERWREHNPNPAREVRCGYAGCDGTFVTSKYNRRYCDRFCRENERRSQEPGRVPVAGRPMVECELPGCTVSFRRGGKNGARRFCCTGHQQAAYHAGRHYRRAEGRSVR